MMNKGGGASQTPLVVAPCWQDTQLAALLQPLIPLSYKENLGEADFLPSRNTAVIFIMEADIISGGGFRRRVVKFRQSSIISAERRIVVLQNTPLTAQHFNNLQKFISIDLGLHVIPVQSLQETAQLLVRMVASETKIQSNPFRMRPRKMGNHDQQLLHSLTSVVPCLGTQRARALLAHFGTLQALAEAPRSAMEEVVGRAAAASVHMFFNGRAEMARGEGLGFRGEKWRHVDALGGSALASVSPASPYGGQGPPLTRPLLHSRSRRVHNAQLLLQMVM